MSSAIDEVPAERRPLHADEYEQLIAAGCFADEKVELLDGYLVTMSPQGDSHEWLVGELGMFFTRAVPKGIAVRLQVTYRLNKQSVPEPDVVIAPAYRFRDRLKGALLVVEVANTSLRQDRGLKVRLYGSGGIPEYWVVDANALTIDVYQQPTAAGYAQVVRFDQHARIAPRALPDVELCLAELIAG